MAVKGKEAFLSPEQILKHRALELAEEQQWQETDERLRSLICIQVDEEIYGLPIESVSEVVSLSEINFSPVPGAPDFIVGLANIRGRLVSIMDVGLFFGLKPRRPKQTAHVVLVQGRDHLKRRLETGLLSDELPLVRDIPEDEMEEPLDSTASGNRDLIEGVSPDLVTILDLPRLLARPEVVVER